MIDAKNKNIWQHENVTSGLKTSAPQQNNGSPSDGKSLQSAVSHPSIINESSADWILSIRAPFVQGVLHDTAVWITSATIIATMKGFSFPYYLQSVQYARVWGTILISR